MIILTACVFAYEGFKNAFIGQLNCASLSVRVNHLEEEEDTYILTALVLLIKTVFGI